VEGHVTKNRQPPADVRLNDSHGLSSGEAFDLRQSHNAPTKDDDVANPTTMKWSAMGMYPNIVMGKGHSNCE
jgi:hypothetical protein